MGIEGIKGVGKVPGAQTVGTKPIDSVSKNIQSEISDVQREKQALSSEEDMSVEEKIKKSRDLQQEIKSLDEQLKQRQEEVLREQQKEALRSELMTENGIGISAEKKEGKEKEISVKDEEEASTKIQNADNKESDVKDAEEKDKEGNDAQDAIERIKGILDASFAAQQESRQNTVIARMESGIVILKGEIRQDEARGMSTDTKEEELKRQEKKLQKAVDLKFPDFEKSDKVLGEGVQVKTDGTENNTDSDQKRDSEDRVIIKATNFSKENIWQ